MLIENTFERFVRISNLSFNIFHVGGFWKAVLVTISVTGAVNFIAFWSLYNFLNPYLISVFGDLSWLLTILLSVAIWFIVGNPISVLVVNLVASLFEDKILASFLNTHYPDKTYKNTSAFVSIFRLTVGTLFAVLTRILFFWVYFIPILNFIFDAAVSAYFTGRVFDKNMLGCVETPASHKQSTGYAAPNVFKLYFLWFALKAVVVGSLLTFSAFTIFLFPLAIVLALLVNVFENFLLLAFALANCADDIKVFS